jgi:ribonuclease HI
MTPIYFDGGCTPNPGIMEVAVAIGSSPPAYHHKRLGRGTNNEAEWLALLWAMELAGDQELPEITLIGDSELVIRQAQGRYDVCKGSLEQHYAQFRLMKEWFDKVELRHVPRDQNLARQHIERRQGSA